MTVQAAIGGTGIAAAVGLASTPTATLAATGASHVALLISGAVTLIMTGVILIGLTRRHEQIGTAAHTATGAPPGA